MVYYEVSLYYKKEDDLNSPPWKGEIKSIKWLKYDTETELPLGMPIIDETLAMKILIQNLQLIQSTLIATNDPHNINKIGESIEYVKNEDDLLYIINGQFEKVTVKKYESDMVIN